MTGMDLDALPLDTLPRQLARTRRSAFAIQLRQRVGGRRTACLCAAGRDDRLAAVGGGPGDPDGAAARRSGAPAGRAAEQLTAAERTRRERTREMSAGIVGFAADRGCGLLAFTLSGQLWVAQPAAARCAGCPPANRPWIPARIPPPAASAISATARCT